MLFLFRSLYIESAIVLPNVSTFPHIHTHTSLCKEMQLVHPFCVYNWLFSLSPQELLEIKQIMAADTGECKTVYTCMHHKY